MIQSTEDFSFIGLFLRADLVVKAVMIALIFASIWCWAIIFEKIARIRRLNKKCR
jgi:biopolymer transport protein TolQ